MLAQWVIAEFLRKRVTDPDYLRAHLRKQIFAVKLTADIATGLEGNFASHGRFKPVMQSGPADFSIPVEVKVMWSNIFETDKEANKMWCKYSRSVEQSRNRLLVMLSHQVSVGCMHNLSVTTKKCPYKNVGHIFSISRGLEYVTLGQSHDTLFGHGQKCWLCTVTLTLKICALVKVMTCFWVFNNNIQTNLLKHHPKSNYQCEIMTLRYNVLLLSNVTLTFGIWTSLNMMTHLSV